MANRGTYGTLSFFDGTMVSPPDGTKPVIFTSMDDDTVGQSIFGSTAIPVCLERTICRTMGGLGSIRNFRFYSRVELSGLGVERAPLWISGIVNLSIVGE